jgi:hypothetical protein
MKEFHVTIASGETVVLKDFDRAIVIAFTVAINSGRPCFIDVICHSEREAEAWGGEDAAERYKSDPEASVFERIEINAKSLGMVA